MWGKSRAHDDAWLPLVRHLQDSAAIAGHLWDEWISPAVQRQIAADLPGGVVEARILYRWLAGIHDVGKATPPFAIKVPTLASQMRDNGLASPTVLADARLMPHALAGQLLVRRWLKQSYDAPELTYDTYACVVGGHHGVPASFVQFTQRPDLLGDGAWQRVQDEILDGMAHLTGAAQHLHDWVQNPLPARAQVLLTALVIVADWLASDEHRFPYGDHHRTSVERAATAWDALGIPPMWRSTAPPRQPKAHIHERFGLVANDVQTAALEVAWNLPEPGLLVLEAPMGSGKTEASLAVAEVLAHRFDLGGVFVALPTMATSDAMFDRVLSWIDSLPVETDQTTFLAHGKAHLNDSFQGLARVDGIGGVYDDDDAGDDAQSAAVVSSWLNGRKKGPLANVVVGTIDQVLVGALQAKHLVLRQLGLASKVVVIDEVHAADEYMQVYLARVLEWLANLGTPVVLLSATLPATQRAELTAAYARGRGSSPPALPQDVSAYPVVTTIDGGAATTQPIDPAGTRRVEVRRLSDDAIGDHLARLLADGGCATVIRNTVARAQQTATAMRERFGDDVVLLHSRFTAPDRRERELDLVTRMGKAGPRPQRLILVGTQVLEQSLDIDADVMVSDLAPIDLLLQRMGRLHRHDRSRPPGLGQAALWVAGAEWDDGAPEFPTGSRRVYGDSRLLRAAATLRPVFESGGLTVPRDIPRLVSTAYGPPSDLAWSEEIEEADAVHERNKQAQLRRASAFLFPPPPWPGESLTDSMPARVGGAPEDGRAQVRDSEDGLEVVAVWRHSDGSLATMPGAWDGADFDVPEHAVPAPEAERALAACTLRLPLALTHPGVIDAVITELEAKSPDAWGDSRWLADQLVLIFDQDLRAELAGHELVYDHDTGLRVTQLEDR